MAAANPLFNLASKLKTRCPPSHWRPPTVEGVKSRRIPLKGCLCRALSNHPDASLKLTVYSMLLQGSVDEKTNVLQCDWGAWQPHEREELQHLTHQLLTDEALKTKIKHFIFKATLIRTCLVKDLSCSDMNYHSISSEVWWISVDFQFTVWLGLSEKHTFQLQIVRVNS